MKEVVETIESKLNYVGLMFRLFSRVKSQYSIKKKIDSNHLYGNGKKLQDIIGIRIVLYFNDDIETVRKIISNHFVECTKDASIDKIKNEEFKALRFNIVYALNEDDIKRLKLNDEEKLYIDTTFELQIRTILSEGWHEVEHDLRYKCKTDWDNFDCYSRRLNGVYASLETSEWTMIKIFDDMAYNHYKNSELSAMFRQKFRLRFTDSVLNNDISKVFELDKELIKKFFRLNRSELIIDMSIKGFYYPMTLNNLIYFANITKIKNESILNLTSKIIIEDMT